MRLSSTTLQIGVWLPNVSIYYFLGGLKSHCFCRGLYSFAIFSAVMMPSILGALDGFSFIKLVQKAKCPQNLESARGHNQ